MPRIADRQIAGVDHGGQRRPLGLQGQPRQTVRPGRLVDAHQDFERVDGQIGVTAVLVDLP